MEILIVILGFALIFLGRKIYWLLASAVGFMLGLLIAEQYFKGQPEKMLVFGLACAVLSGLLAVLFRKFGIFISGFVAGGYFSIRLIDLFVPDLSFYIWIIFIAGGLLCAVLLMSIFEWTLMIMSSGAGAFLVVKGLSPSLYLAIVLFIALFFLGIIFQNAIRHYEGRKPRKIIRTQQHAVRQ